MTLGIGNIPPHAKWGNRYSKFTKARVIELATSAVQNFISAVSKEVESDTEGAGKKIVNLKGYGLPQWLNRAELSLEELMIRSGSNSVAGGQSDGTLPPGAPDGEGE